MIFYVFLGSTEPPKTMLARKRPREINSDNMESSSQSESDSSSESAAELLESSEEPSSASTAGIAGKFNRTSVQASDEPSSARPCSSTTCQRRAKAKELYLHGKSRKPYHKGPPVCQSDRFTYY